MTDSTINFDANYEHAKAIALRYAGPRLPKDDAKQTGALALLQALATYNTTANPKPEWRAYLTVRVKTAIAHAVAAHRGTKAHNLKRATELDDPTKAPTLGRKARLDRHIWSQTTTTLPLEDQHGNTNHQQLLSKDTQAQDLTNTKELVGHIKDAIKTTIATEAAKPKPTRHNRNPLQPDIITIFLIHALRGDNAHILAAQFGRTGRDRVYAELKLAVAILRQHPPLLSYLTT